MQEGKHWNQVLNLCKKMTMDLKSLKGRILKIHKMQFGKLMINLKREKIWIF